MKKYIMELSKLFAPSGNEGRVVEYIKSAMSSMDCGAECTVDPLNNLIVHKRGGGRRLAVACYTDERGLFVSHIEENGHVRFCAVGKGAPENFLNRTVMLENGTTAYVCSDKSLKEECKVSDLYLVSAGKPVKIGDVGVAGIPYSESDNCIIGKALDRSAVCAAVMGLAELEADCDLYMVFSSMYQLGKKGLLVALDRIRPDYAVILDTVAAEQGEKSTFVKVGGGPVVKLKEGPYVADRLMTELAHSEIVQPYAAGEAQIPAKQAMHFGILSGNLAIPVEYHGYFTQRIDCDDVYNTCNLLKKIVKNF